jgi:hypothetical protein
MCATVQTVPLNGTRKEEMDLDLSDLGLEITKPQAALSEASLLFYGEQGCGKTTLAATAVDVPELAPVLVIDMENSSAAVARKYGEHPDLDVVQVRDWVKLERLIDHLCVSPVLNGKRYRTVILDPVNDVGRLLQQHMIKLVEHKRRLLRKSELGGKLTETVERQLKQLSSVKIQDSVNNSLGEATTSLPDYGILGAKAGKIIGNMSSAEFLAIMGKEILAQKPHLVGFMQMAVSTDEDGKEKVDTLVRFVPGTVGSLPFKAKRRLEGTPNALVNPTMGTIWNHITNGGMK